MSKKRVVEEMKNVNVANADSVYDEIMNIIRNILITEGEVSLNTIGKLKLKNKPARTGRNPKTGENITIPETTVVKFSASKNLKDAVK